MIANIWAWRTAALISLIMSIGVVTVTQSQATTNAPSQSDTEGTFWSDGWIYGMIASGFFSALCITGMMIHSLYHFTHDRNKVTGTMRYLYLCAFSANLLSSLQYATLKVDLLFPIGHPDSIISCKIAYAAGIVGLGVSRFLVMSLFCMRIHQTFAGSALAYPWKNLLGFGLFYCCGGAVLMVAMLYFALPVVEYRLTDSGIGVCSIFDGTLGTRVTQGSFVLLDTIMSIIVAYLFVRKLRQLVALTSDHPRTHRARSVEQTTSSAEDTTSNGGNSSPGANTNTKKPKLDVKKQKHERKRSDSKSGHSSHNDKLKRIMHKQTLLVVIAIASSMTIFFAGAIYAAISLLIPCDLLVNAICIWFMFRFADNLWNRIVHFCDCCGCCGDFKDQYIARMNTLSRLSRLSVHNLSPKAGAVKSPITVTNEAGTTELYRKPSGHDPIEPQMTDRNESPPKMDPMPVASSTPEISAHNSFDGNGHISDYEQ